MVMPFSRKATGRTEEGVPAEVDFDALWGRVLQHVLRELGYHAARAEQSARRLRTSRARRCGMVSEAWWTGARRSLMRCRGSRSRRWTGSRPSKETMAELSQFEADVRAVRAAPESEQPVRASHARSLRRPAGGPGGGRLRAAAPGPRPPRLEGAPGLHRRPSAEARDPAAGRRAGGARALGGGRRRRRRGTAAAADRGSWRDR